MPAQERRMLPQCTEYGPLRTPGCGLYNNRSGSDNACVKSALRRSPDCDGRERWLPAHCIYKGRLVVIRILELRHRL